MAKEKPKSKQKQIGVVSNYFEHVSVAAIKLTDSLKLGDTIRVVGGESDFEQVIDSMQLNHKFIEKAKKGDEIGIKISEKVRKDYKVFKV